MLGEHDGFSPFGEVSVDMVNRPRKAFCLANAGEVNLGETAILKAEQNIVSGNRTSDCLQLHSEKRMTVKEFQSQLPRQLRCIRFANCLPWQ